MYRYINELKWKHKGQDVYVLGSGASLNFINKSFFDNKIVVGINWMHKFFKCDYSFVKDIVNKEGFDNFINSTNKHKSILVTPENHNGIEHYFDTEFFYYICQIDKWGGFANTEMIGTDTIINAHLTVCSAIHFAYYLGASNIILGGVDCGLLDDKVHIDNYYQTEKHIEILKRVVSHPYNEVNIKRIRKKLNSLGCGLYSINPFINIGLEEHKYSKTPIPTNELWAGEIKE
jgi:hypothetical protein